jgi:hypothetical protein
MSLEVLVDDAVAVDILNHATDLFSIRSCLECASQHSSQHSSLQIRMGVWVSTKKEGHRQYVCVNIYIYINMINIYIYTHTCVGYLRFYL